QCWHDTYEGIIPIDIQDKFIDLAYSDDMMAKRLNGSLLLVAEIGTAIIGFANFSFLNDAKETELNAIYLLNHAQGCGVGSALLKRAISELSGVKTIIL